jgi:hypothetical protein
MDLTAKTNVISKKIIVPASTNIMPISEPESIFSDKNRAQLVIHKTTYDFVREAIENANKSNKPYSKPNTTTRAEFRNYNPNFALI